MLVEQNDVQIVFLVGEISLFFLKSSKLIWLKKNHKDEEKFREILFCLSIKGFVINNFIKITTRFGS